MTLFTTKNLKIERILTDDDLNKLLLIHNCEETMRWIPKSIINCNTEYLINKYAINDKLYSKSLGIYKISLKTSKKNILIGEMLLLNFEDKADFIEIGYILFKDYWKKGLGTELVVGIETYMKQQETSITLIAQLYEENKASQALLEKLEYEKVRTEVLQSNKIKLTYHKKL